MTNQSFEFNRIIVTFLGHNVYSNLINMILSLIGHASFLMVVKAYFKINVVQ